MSPTYHYYRFKYRFARWLNLTKPVDVSLELSSYCNMRCGYCYHSNQRALPFKRGIMKYDVAAQIIGEAAHLGVHSLKMNWKGESTQNPEFEAITALAKSLSSGSTFIERITNSNFKFNTSKDGIFRGLANQTKVKVSYDSFKKKVFETQRKGGDHDVTTANVDKFYNWPKRKTRIVIQAVRTKLNKNEDIEGEAKRRWPEAEISIRDMVGGRTGDDISSFEDRARDYSERQSCIQAHARVIFNWDGKAFVCCPDIKEQLTIGDINETNLLEIFNSEKAKEIRKSLKDKTAFKSDPCKTCSSFETFKGFRPNWHS